MKGKHWKSKNNNRKNEKFCMEMENVYKNELVAFGFSRASHSYMPTNLVTYILMWLQMCVCCCCCFFIFLFIYLFWEWLNFSVAFPPSHPLLPSLTSTWKCVLSVFMSNGWKIQWNDSKICRFYLMCLSSQFFYSLNFLPIFF